MFTKIYSCTARGIDVTLTPVEIDYRPGIGYFNINGLSGRDVLAAKDRVVAAINNSGYLYVGRHLAIDVRNVDTLKHHSHLDLAIALGYLVVSKQLSFVSDHKVFIGELGLDGSVRAVPQLINLLLGLNSPNIKEVYVPAANMAELSLLPELKFTLYPINNLKELAIHLQKPRLHYFKPQIKQQEKANHYINILEWDKFMQSLHPVLQLTVAIVIAGGHNVLFTGSPGTGKSFLLEKLSQFLPPLLPSQQLELDRIYSLNGHYQRHITPPVIAPHHSATVASLIGGGNPPYPGAVSLAQYGILILDELLEFNIDVLNCLREPLTQHQVMLSRGNFHYHYPAYVQVIGGCNPCHCGNLGNAKRNCTCTNAQLRQYRQRLPAALLDRFDIVLNIDHLYNLNSVARETKMNLTLLHKVRMQSWYQHKKWMRDVSGVDNESSLLNQDYSKRQQKQLFSLAATYARINDRASVEQSDLHVATVLYSHGRALLRAE
jgi:magnesium chelatase family protein